MTSSNERLCALHTLAQGTALCGLITLLMPLMMALMVIPLHIYFAVHIARELGAGRWSAAGLGVVAVFPLANTLLLIALNQRLGKRLADAGVQRGWFGYWRKPVRADSA